MTFDPFKIVKEIQKGLRGLSKKAGKSGNPKFKEIEKRLKEIDEKLEEKFSDKQGDEENK